MDKFKIFDYTTQKLTNDGETFSIQENFGDEIKVLHSTGLHDINGKEIFEGDILRFINDGYYSQMAVFFIKGDLDGATPTFVAGFKVGLSEEGAIFNIRKDSEVIGNIFENPELLK